MRQSLNANRVPTGRLLVCSTFFLMGPMAQLRSMFAPQRACASVTYVVSMVLTLYFAIGVCSTDRSVPVVRACKSTV